MTKKTIQIIVIGILILFGTVSIWQMISIQNLDSFLEKKTEKIDYAQLERAVSSWEKKKEFSFKGMNENSTSTSSATISVLNGSGISGAANELSDKLEDLPGVEVSSVGNTLTTETTSVAFKDSVSQDLLDKIIALLESDYESVTQKKLSDDGEFDVIISIGKSK